MKKKCKYLLIILILLFLIAVRGCISFFTGGYSAEVYTAFSTGPGFEIKDSTFFSASYRLFRQPVGLRRFPDGGQSKRIFEAVYIVEMKGDSLNEIYKVPDFSLSDSDIKYTRGIIDKKGLKLLFSEIGTENYYIADCYGRKHDAEKVGEEKIAEAGFAKPSLNITETKKIFKQLVRVPESEIPSPLKYSGKKKKQYIKDVVSLNGDFYYRAAVIDLLSDSEVSDLQERMKKYEESLKKGKLEYSIYSEDTKKYINKRLGL